MLAIYLAPLYVLINLYLLRWMYLWMGSCHSILRTLAFRIVFAVAYTLVSTSLLSGFLIKKPAWLHRILKIIGNYFLGIFLYVLMIILVADIGRLLFKYVFHFSWIWSPLAFTLAGAVCSILIITISIFGIFHAKKIKVSSYNVTVDKTVPDTDSLKIVLLADTHFGYNAGAIHAQEIVNKINQQNPDLVCIAGDIFDNEFDAIREPEEIEKILQTIHSRYGVYACWGNHDLNEPILAGFTFNGTKDSYNDPRMEEFLTDAGIHLLDDESVLIDNKFYIVGRRDASRCEKVEGSRQTPAQLTQALDQSKPIIFIDHQPKELSETAAAGVDLDLCGHTHDGQIFPGNLIIHLFWENSCGYLQKGSMHNIVTSGAGIWGPSMRVGTDSEICPITIHFTK